jgi:hypothetical protein
MRLERKALYNLLRMNWLADPSLEVEEWEVDDYRTWDPEDLIAVVAEFDGPSSRSAFLEEASPFDDPEQMTASLGSKQETEKEDRLYLALFELWRRWLPERPSLSIFCDDLDRQIQQYDAGEAAAVEQLADTVASLQDLLDESADDGHDPEEVFGQVAARCANDLAGFLYDYISDQIDGGSHSYASELIEGYLPYLKNDPWFAFLRAKLTAVSDIDQANRMLKEILDSKTSTLELNLEMLQFLSQSGDRDLFIEVAHKSLPLLEREEDLLELLESVAQYYRCLDCDALETRINSLIEERSEFAPEQKLRSRNSVLKQVRALLAAPHEG